jgi:anti-anti-sigma factor
MNISTRSLDEIVAIDIEGKLDTQTSTPALEQLLQILESSPGKVLISLTPLEFVSSAGLRVILRVAKQVRGYGGELKVSGAQGVVKEVLEISGFDSLLDLYEDEEQAVGSFQ